MQVTLKRFGIVQTDLYTKPKDKHQYLLHSSCHPLHSKRAIPFSLALRLRRICSSDETFTLQTKELIQYLNDHGYNRSFLQHEIQRVHAIRSKETLKPSQTTSNQLSTWDSLCNYHSKSVKSSKNLLKNKLKHCENISNSFYCK